jgi:multicomponent Na+:H+ antiporter subunit C
MYGLLAILVGTLFGTGIFLMLRRSLVRLIFGLAMISHAVNLLIFTTGGLARGNPPIVPPGSRQYLPPAGHADPVPQALVLTAIVIGFGLLAFTSVLVKQVARAAGTDDVDELRTTDR